jgi:hypothetical protein
MTPGRYCRDVESYLCKKNDGHLIRIVGPSFELVCGWAGQQIPIRVVCRAIDRTFERYYSKGARRRPVRIEFCEADVLEMFDDWRRAVGVSTTGLEDTAHRGRRASLATHIERVRERLASWLGAGQVLPVAELTGRVLEELPELAEDARRARGDARRRIVDRLAELDGALGAVVQQSVQPDVRRKCHEEATRDLEPFLQRMPPDALRRALASATGRLLDDHVARPRIAFE